MGYYNGLALYNPADQPNEVRLTVRNAEGQVTGEKSLTMPPGSRLANLLPELIPSTAGQIRGTIRVTSSLGVIAQELFGTNDFLAAVPAWPVVR